MCCQQANEKKKKRDFGRVHFGATLLIKGPVRQPGVRGVIVFPTPHKANAAAKD